MRGRVTVDGQHASAGHLTFQPNAKARGKGGMSVIQSDGSYVLRGVPLGEVTFAIAPQKKTGKQIQTVDPMGRKVTAEEFVPLIEGAAIGAGQSTVILEVSPAMAYYDFRLSSQIE